VVVVDSDDDDLPVAPTTKRARQSGALRFSDGVAPISSVRMPPDTLREP
jgi:hypothetical protein